MLHGNSRYYDLLGRAFACDPMASWLFKDAKRHRVIHDVFDFMFRLGENIGPVDSIDGPDGKPEAVLVTTTRYGSLDSVSNILRAGLFRLLRRIGPRHFFGMLSYNAKAGAMHAKYGRPDDVYVFIIATHPDAQGRGHGSALLSRLKAGLSSGSRIYLETSNPTNLPFYESNGFRRLDDYVVPGTEVHIWPMLCVIEGV